MGTEMTRDQAIAFQRDLEACDVPFRGHSITPGIRLLLLDAARKVIDLYKRRGWIPSDINENETRVVPAFLDPNRFDLKLPPRLLKIVRSALNDGSIPIGNYAGEVKRRGDTLHVDLWYPPTGDEYDAENPRHIAIDLMHVRASDGIRIRDDFERDGWVIEQPEYAKDSSTGETCMLDTWREVAFCRSWQNEEEAE